MNMNTMSKTLINGLAIISAFAFTQFATAQDAAKVIFKSGNAVVKHANGKEEPLSKNSALNAGDTIETRQGRVQFKTIDGGKVSLQPETIFKFNRYEYSGAEDGSEYAITELVKGGLRTITGVIGHKNRDRYQLKTPVATIGIRGTEFSLTYGNKLVMSTLHGSVDVCNAGGCINAITGQSVATNAFDAKPIYTQEKAQVGAAPAAKKRVFVKARQLNQVASLEKTLEKTTGEKVSKSDNAPIYKDTEREESETIVKENTTKSKPTGPILSKKDRDEAAIQDAINAQDAADAADAAKAAADADAAQAAEDAAAAQAAADAAAAQAAAAEDAAAQAAAQAAADAAAQVAADAAAAQVAADAAAAQATADATAAQAANKKDIIVASVSENLIASLTNQQNGAITVDSAGNLTSFDNGSYLLTADTHNSYIDQHVALDITTGDINGITSTSMSYIVGDATTKSQLLSFASLGDVTYKILAYTTPVLVNMNNGQITAYANDQVKGRLKINFANLNYDYRLKVDQTVDYGSWEHTLIGNGALSEQASFSDVATVNSQYSGLGENVVNANFGSNNNGTVQGQLFGQNAERAGIQYSINVEGVASAIGDGALNNLSGSVVLDK